MGKAEATREKILNAALDEFAAFGIAGARVGRISKKAACNKNLIYVYFESKETLFATVLQKYIDRAFEEIPFTPRDLPGYAVKVFDFAMTNPKLIRLMRWAHLEEVSVNLSERMAIYREKLQQITDAQNSGHISDVFPPSVLLATVMTLATAWTPTNPFGPVLDSEVTENLDVLRESISREITLMVQRT
ncbi:TetR family transcriptional regulator [Salibacterium sp. K-3]